MNGSVQLLERFTQADGAPGFEDAVRDVFIEAVGSAGEVTVDRLGNVLCRKSGTADQPRVMLDCHLDEVGFVIQHITSSGFLKFLPLGGWWPHTLLAQRVRVHGPDEGILGIIGSTPPHFLPKERRSQVLEFRDLFLDVGASSREEVESWGIRVGSWAVPYSPFAALAREDRYVSKAFDNRVGCALCVEALREVDDHPNAIVGSGSVQEEVGLRGATTAADAIDPDVAIVLEGPPADDTPGFNPDESQGALGSGVQIRAYDPTMIANPRLVKFTLDVASELNIPHQVTVRASGGTDAARIHTSARGVPTIVLGVPARYIHSHTSVIQLDDYRATRDLTVALLQRLDADRVGSF